MQKTLQEEILNSRLNIKVGSKCKYVVDGSVKKRGVAVAINSNFTQIYDDSKDSGDASKETSEWFPFSARPEGKAAGIVLI